MSNARVSFPFLAFVMSYSANIEGEIRCVQRKQSLIPEAQMHGEGWGDG